MQASFARWTAGAAVLTQAVVIVLLDAEFRGGKGIPHALKRGYLNRLTARVELVPFPVVKCENIFTVVSAAEER